MAAPSSWQLSRPIYSKYPVRRIRGGSAKLKCYLRSISTFAIDVLTVVMVFQCEVPQPEVDQACEERETALGRALEGWEREIVKAFLTNQNLKGTTPEEKTSITELHTKMHLPDCILASRSC